MIAAAITPIIEAIVKYIQPLWGNDIFVDSK